MIIRLLRDVSLTVTIENQLQIVKLRPIYLKLSGTRDYRDVMTGLFYVYEVLLLFNGDHGSR